MFVGLHIFLKGLGSIGAFLMDIAVVILNWASTAHESYAVFKSKNKKVNHFKMGIFSFYIIKKLLS
jgi:hypothetical protein